ncbi:hypothetical protein ALC53_09286 [Atta colombica]|uniref:Uncharacterized protein n=1 Tax=Atta colombica TaxID=520822 RepID=A0A195B7H2_9HYME|nr:hypothetical protein ALC53_09286 [Atta colombica]
MKQRIDVTRKKPRSSFARLRKYFVYSILYIRLNDRQDRVRDCEGRNVLLEGSFNLSVRSLRRNIGDVSSKSSALLEDSSITHLPLVQSPLPSGRFLSTAVLTISAAVSRIDLTASRSPGSRGSLSIQSSTLERSPTASSAVGSSSPSSSSMPSFPSSSSSPLRSDHLSVSTSILTRHCCSSSGSFFLTRRASALSSSRIQLPNSSSVTSSPISLARLCSSTSSILSSS